MQRVFCVEADAVLNVSAYAEIDLTAGPDGAVSVWAEGAPEFVEQLEVTLEGNRVRVHFDPSQLSISKSSVNGKTSWTIRLNGQRVEWNESAHPLRISITAPAGIGAEFGRAVTLKSRGRLGQVRLDSESQSRFYLSEASTVRGKIGSQSRVEVRAVTQAIDLSIESMGELQVADASGSVTLQVASQGQAEVGGSFTRLDLNAGSMGQITINGDLSGNCQVDADAMAQVTTTGVVSGSYSVTAGSMSKVRHKGSIKGRVSRSIGSMAQVDVG